MILVDKDIKKLVKENNLINTAYKEENVGCVSYDITLESVLLEDKEVQSFDILPGQTVIIKTQEEVKVPENILIRVAEKNSLIRYGIKVEGPHYFPGHQTFIFLRVTNLTEKSFTLSKGLNIAQLIFEQLTQSPETPYNLQKNASFNNEKVYTGAGNYSNEYQKLSKKIESAKESLESIKEKLYTNIIAIMGIFVSIFTLVSVNIQAFVNKEVTVSVIAAVNLCMISAISVLMGLIFLIAHKSKKTWFMITYLILLTVLILSTVYISLCR